MIDRGPLDGGFSAQFIIDDKSHVFSDVVNRLKSVVCVATAQPNGQLSVQFIHSDNRLLAHTLKRAEVLQGMKLPLFVIRIQHNPAPDAAPEPVS
jgi:hypothetical protein